MADDDARTCTHPDGCPRPMYGRTGLCPMHYQRRWKTGDIGEAGASHVVGATLQERWELGVNRGGAIPDYASHLGPCWEWMRTRGKVGYGVLWYDGKLRYAHRVAYELFIGPIPDGLTIDHLCHVRCCVNPAHLDAVTLDVNKARGESPAAVNARKSHCKHGHEFDETNTRVRADGSRSCKACEVRNEARRIRTKR